MNNLLIFTCVYRISSTNIENGVAKNIKKVSIYMDYAGKNMSYVPCYSLRFFSWKPSFVLKAPDAKHQTSIITLFINVCMMKNIWSYYGIN